MKREANGGLELEEAPFILVAGQGVNSREKITRLKELQRRWEQLLASAGP